MPFVRKKRGQILVVHSQRTADGKIVQHVLCRFESPAELAAVLAPSAWRIWAETMAWSHPDHVWTFDELRARLGRELRRWSAGPDGGARRRKVRVLRLLDDLTSALDGLAPASATDADLIAAARPKLEVLARHTTRLLGEGTEEFDEYELTTEEKERSSAMQQATGITREQQAAEDVFDQGMEHWWRGARRDACARFRDALRRWPGHVDALNHLGVDAMDRRRLADASRFLSAALASGVSALELEDGRAQWTWLQNRPYLRALVNLGRVRSRQGRYQEALVIFERALALNPDDDQGVRLLLGEQHHRLGRLSEALSAYTEAGDEPGCQYGLALALHQAGRTHERDAALLRSFAANRYIAPMLLGLPWDRVEGSHGTGMAEPEWAADYVARFGDLWRKDKSAGAALRAWWTAEPVRAWLAALAQCMVALASDEQGPERSAAITRMNELEGRACIARLQLDVQGGWAPDAR